MSKSLALIGCGAIAVAHAGAIQTLGAARCRLTALVEIDAERAQNFARQFAPNAQIFGDLETLLQSARPDVVLICTPPALHATLATNCLEAGIAVLSEKPLATSATSARTLVELSRSRGVTLRTAAKYRFCDGVIELQERVRSGDLGRIERLRITFGAPVAMAGRWQVDASQSGGGVLMDNGPHAIDLARFVLGEVRLTGCKLGFGADFCLEDEAQLGLESQGAAVSIELSWRRALGECFLQVESERGALEVNWAEGYDKSAAFSRQLSAFLDAIEPYSPQSEIWRDDDGWRAVEIIEAAYRMAPREEESL